MLFKGNNNEENWIWVAGKDTTIADRYIQDQKQGAQGISGSDIRKNEGIQGKQSETKERNSIYAAVTETVEADKENSGRKEETKTAEPVSSSFGKKSIGAVQLPYGSNEDVGKKEFLLDGQWVD
ncbi:MAG: hypothetical protein JW803_04320 [Endomicrobiales bacterium]|nr:hypothetical protein [Endomicrobiales bacterium]